MAVLVGFQATMEYEVHSVKQSQDIRMISMLINLTHRCVVTWSWAYPSILHVHHPQSISIPHNSSTYLLGDTFIHLFKSGYSCLLPDLPPEVPLRDDTSC